MILDGCVLVFLREYGKLIFIFGGTVMLRLWSVHSLASISVPVSSALTSEGERPPSRKLTSWW